jgi:YHS domain-containing protein
MAPLVLVLMLAVAGTGVALQMKSSGREAVKAGAAQSTSLRKVETKKVCMVTNRVFTKDQIPVTVQGKTYYGCCEGCKQALANNPAARTAIDPVSGKTVDKATAVIGARPDGSTLYFENESNLKTYSSRTRG